MGFGLDFGALGTIGAAVSTGREDARRAAKFVPPVIHSSHRAAWPRVLCALAISRGNALFVYAPRLSYVPASMCFCVCAGWFSVRCAVMCIMFALAVNVVCLECLDWSTADPCPRLHLRPRVEWHTKEICI